MSAGFTPGPWKNYGRIALSPGLPHSAVAAKTLIARVYSEAFGDSEQEAANARLIAAAPALLSALVVAEKALNDIRCCCQHTAWDATGPAVIAARAAIAAATATATEGAA